MGHIIWLASYPKSGNTWFRVFLTNLMQDNDRPADINDLEKTPIAAAREIFDDIVGIEAADLSFDEVDRLRPELYRFLSDRAKETCFLKIHDAYTFLDDGRPLVPPEATRGVIYIIRNPLDVAVSFAHHMDASIDKAIERMADENFYFAAAKGGLNEQLRQKLLSWSGHVRSWTETENLDVHIMRYEDMKQNPHETFTRAVQFAGLDNSETQIKKALEFSRFDEMQRQEAEDGFKEKPVKAQTFFRKGDFGTWRDVLEPDQVKRIIDSQEEIMKRFGYLDENGEPVF
jgi:hypothetical protein